MQSTHCMMQSSSDSYLGDLHIQKMRWKKDTLSPQRYPFNKLNDSHSLALQIQSYLADFVAIKTPQTGNKLVISIWLTDS